MDKDSVAPQPRKRWWVRVLLTLVLLLLVLVIAAPWILGNTGLRDRLVAALVDDPSVQITTRHASLGYFTPFSLQGLQINAADGATSVEIEKIQAEKSWLAMLLNRPDLGDFAFVRPVVDVVIPDDTAQAPTTTREPKDSPPPADRDSNLPELSAEIEDASITVRKPGHADPVVDLQNVNVTFHLQRNDVGSVLVIDPVTVFDHEELTPELCNQGLHLVAPLLAQELGANGEFSFQLDQFRVPLGGKNVADEARRVEIAGSVHLHRASVGLKDSIVARIVELAVHLLGESVPEMMTVANDCEVKFHLVDGRIHHQGFALMLPFRESHVQLESSGFVSMEGELDVMVAIQLPVGNLGHSELAKMFSSDPIQVSITGTLEDPQVSLAGEHDWHNRFSDLFSKHKSDESVESDESEEADDPDEQLDKAVEIAERVSTMLEEIRENAKNRDADPDTADGTDENERLFPNLRNRFQERRERRRNEIDNR